jgi:hypothetical protein
MKKVFVFLLTLALLCSMTAAALAMPYNEQIITTTVPDQTPSWTMVIPANIDIPFGDQVTEFAPPTITDAQYVDLNDIALGVKHTGKFLCGDNVLPFTLMQSGDLILPRPADSFGYPINPRDNLQLVISGDAWSNAAAGTYMTTLIYTSQINIILR